MATVIKEARYKFTDIENNNNKYWYAFLYDDGTFETHWNRIGEAPNKTVKQGFSEQKFNTTCRSKERKGYVLFTPLDASSSGTIQVENSNLEDVAKKQIQHSNPIVEDLISRLTKANVHAIMGSTNLTYNVDTGLFSTPLGIVDKNTIDTARDLLTKIGNRMEKKDTIDASYQKLVNDYCMQIPQDVGRKKLSVDLIFPDLNAVQKHNQILDDLEVSVQTVLSGAHITSDEEPEEVDTPQVFATKLELVEDGKIFDRINKKFLDTLDRGYACGHLRPKVIYAVEIEGMKQPFEEKGKPLGEVMELWHGSRAGNCLSILSKGLIIMGERSSVITGSLFGRGLYFASSASKSLNYSYGYWSGAKQDNNPFMFLGDVAMGKYYLPKDTYDGPYPKPGYDSTYAQKGKTSGLLNNEMIIYNNYQCNLTFLVEFSPQGK